MKDSSSPGQVVGVNLRAFLDQVRLFACIAGLTGCGSSNSSTPGSASAEGGGKGTGVVEGHSFGAVGASYLIGKSDDPANTTVIYLFDAPVACGNLGAPGWDATIASGTGALEIKLLGTQAGDYPVSATPIGGSGESSVNFTVSSTQGAPNEESSNGWTVTLDAVTPGKSADGSFDLTFSDGTLRGTFAAAWCADGHEP